MNTTSPLDGHRSTVSALIAEGNSYREIARLLLRDYGLLTSEGSIRRAVKRWGVRAEQQGEPNFDKEFERPNFRMAGDEAHITSDPRAWKDYLNNTDQLIRERGLDPEDWEIKNCVINEWDWHGQTYKQLKVHLVKKRRLEVILPARVSLGKAFKGVRATPSEAEPELVVFLSDQHAPHHDPELHKRVCAFLYHQCPERVYFLGDTLDLSNISRHPSDPEWDHSTQECVDAAGQILVDCREAAPTAYMEKVPGNHDERLRRVVLDKIADWYGLTPTKLPGLPDLPPIHSPAHLLRLDELDIHYTPPKGSYDHAHVMVTPFLAARHGWVARKGSGSSGLATLDHLGHSVVVGHTHRQGIVHQTKHDIHGKASIRAAAEIGCLCKIEQGLGYAPAPDWQQGFATATVWPDGRFHLDLATYIDKKLYWRSERY